MQALRFPHAKYLLGAALLLCFLSRSTLAEVSVDSSRKVLDVEPTPIAPLYTLIEYPPEAKKQGIEGKVRLSILIDTSGSVLRAVIEESSNPVFNECAKTAAMKMKFHPAIQGDKHVLVWWNLPITFRLGSDSTKTGK